MTRRLLAAVLAALALALVACAPVAGVARDLLDSRDGATLAYVVEPPGLRFDPGGEPALGVIVVATGAELRLVTFPAGAACTETPERVRCDLGELSAPQVVGLVGRGVLASATYRRADSPAVRQTFAR